MNRIVGKSVSGGIAMGKIVFYYNSDLSMTVHHIEDISSELDRFESACEEAARQIDSLYESVVSEIGENNARILEVHKMLIRDENFVDAVKGIIRERKLNAEAAVVYATNDICESLRSVDNQYFKDRVADIRDISGRIVRAMSGNSSATGFFERPYVLLAEDISPSELFQFDREKILGIVIREGSPNSHMTILAKSMNLPVIIRADIFKSFNGRFAIVDGDIGEIIVDPDEEKIEVYKARIRKQEEVRRLQKELIGKPDITKDGKLIKLYASINDDSDMDQVIKNDAAGIGLFRTEFLYLKEDRYPTEEEQYDIYSSVIRRMEGKEVVIRTCDVGLDKTKEYLAMPKENNPALGYRGIRMSLDRKDVFLTQLRAVYRAAFFGRVTILYPMIINVEEIRMIKKINEEAVQSLRKEHLNIGDVRQGIMIETPAAALISDQLAREADYLSIGTNDLTQYTLALDRLDERADPLFDRKHPAVRKLIEMTINNAHKEGCSVGICGEIPTDEISISELIRMGIDEIAVAPSEILPIRGFIRDSYVS
ncbi:MAG: phosphoenolpyruvate--protein phosphotransferase [Lachnospiraceae bacterium]|nr:phosphoenolpyruvate--protein phosphotransferase [Lachnospiraceae bacterium]